MVTLTVVTDPEVAMALAVVAKLHRLTRGEALRKVLYEWLRAQEAALQAPPIEPSAAQRATTPELERSTTSWMAD
ncbi:hypothetical protein LAUMK35_04051 [Mycobacterium pseudokansasii]|nr:hypothetical protein A4G27_05470 [Mycobacterium kansasii]VAZ98577.1 hypothetical protein LAUMK35_04051 [Mycobacterium pseudokansasii]VAZ99995.1 hypothetical protein LAUMK21_04047 [Mycobacterium pseudokansasii]